MTAVLPLALMLSQGVAHAGASVSHDMMVDESSCFSIPAFELEFCFVDNGLIHSTESASGNLSLRIKVETDIEVYLAGELVSSQHSEENGHGLWKAGDDSWFQIHDSYCVEGEGWAYSSFVNVANGEVKHEVVEDDGC